jgi:hypothetical protein
MIEPSLDINDFEKIIRSIKTPYYWNPKKKVLKPAAFRPKAGLSVVSVIRHIMGDDFCKNKSVEIAKDSYIGLAVITARQIRILGSEVVDYREDFLGHAHVDHGFPALPPDEPQGSIENEKMQLRCKALADASTFFLDPDPKQFGWTGTPL